MVPTISKWLSSSVPTEDPQCGKITCYNAINEIRHCDFIKSYYLYCYSRKNNKIIRSASEKDKHKTKVFNVTLYAL